MDTRFAPSIIALEMYKVCGHYCRRPDRHRHLQRLVGLQGRGLGRHSVERGDLDAQGRAGGAEERSDDHIRRLNQEAGKMVHYGGATEDEAIRMVTLNPAWIIGVDDRTGSIDVGKDADLVLWNHDPLSTYARAQKVYIDGDLFFDASLPGLGTTHFNGVMHDDRGFGGEDEEDGQ